MGFIGDGSAEPARRVLVEARVGVKGVGVARRVLVIVKVAASFGALEASDTALVAFLLAAGFSAF
jgi:hypothetical protein